MKKVEKVQKRRLVLLDAHALLHRAYHALPEFTSSKGVPTGGLYGYISMILRIIGDWKPDYIIACYDLPQKTFRHEAYDAYKGHRAKTDDALVEQIESSRLVCEKMGIPIYDLPGFEADDMLGTIVEQTKGDKNLEILIATGDMDSLQLVDDKKVRVFTLKKGINDTVVYDEDAVVARFGFGPESLPDFKGLRGDPSDNIVGVPGIGEKTATELILKFKTIENIYKNLHVSRDVLIKSGIKERIVKLLEENEEGALFSKTLATIRRDAPIEFKLPEKVWSESIDMLTIENVLREFEFKSLIVRLKEILQTPPSGSRSSPDTSSCQEEGKAPVEAPRDLQIALWLLNSELPNPAADDIFAYTKTKNFDDARKVLEQEIKNNNLDFIYNNIELPLVPVLKGMQQHGVLLDTEFLKTLSVDLHERLTVFEKKIYEHVGHEFNVNSPKQLGEVLFGEMQIHANIKGFKIKKTASGTYSTRESDLEKLEDAHPIIKDIFNYRELQKLLSTYIDTLPSLVDEGSRIHPELLQMGAATGRFACKDPNIQNIPIRSEEGKKIRNAFIAPKGYSLVSADYSQIELRSAAILSGDPVFMDTFTSGKDVHASVASRVFHVAEPEVTSDMRRKAKVINFGILYGMGVTALQKNLGTTRAEAQAFHDEYFKQLAKLSDYLEQVLTNAKKMGYTETLFGRRRFFPALKSSIPFIKAMAERAAGNAPIQGTTADIIKLAMLHVDQAIKDAGLSDKVFMIMQIHDELVFEVKEEVLEQAEKLIKDTMENVLIKKWENRTDSFRDGQGVVPIDVSISHGKTWGEAKD
jgi:DNA polymerase-1